MGKQEICGRIISDAEAEARAIIKAAEDKAEKTVAAAELQSDRNRKGVEAETAEKVRAILDGKAATARLDGAKVLLGEKRAVIDSVYGEALKKLVALGKTDALALAENLLNDFAEDGDEIVFAANYPYASDVAKLGAVKKKNLKVSPKNADIDGGFILIGINSDKNLSYGALLAADREEHQAEIASRLFND